MEQLRCASCSHAIGHASVAMRLVGLFKASLAGRVPKRTPEIRRRCNSCGWVNVFYPMRHASREIELKAS